MDVSEKGIYMYNFYGNKVTECKNKELTILVISYDGAKELWHPFSQAWEKFWADCPFDKVLITQNISQVADGNFDNIIPVASEASKAVFRIREALNHIDSEYILLMCDDYFLKNKPESYIFTEIINLMQCEEISCVHLQNKRKYMNKIVLNEIENRNFLISGGIPCIYQKEFLTMLCEKFSDCTMREFETRASRWLQKEKAKIKNVENSSFICHHCVLEGYWRLKPYRWCKKSNINILCKTYKKPNFMHSVRACGKALAFNIALYLFPEIYKKWSLKRYK